MGTNIYIFANSYKPELGGIQTVTSQFAETIHQRGGKVCVVTNVGKKNFLPISFICGVPVVRLPFRYKFGIVTPFLFLLFLFRRPKAVYVHFPQEMSKYVLKLRKYFTFDIITCFHGHDVMMYYEEYEKDNELYRSKCELVHASNKVTACSVYLAKKVEEMFSCANVIPVHNGVDLSRFNERKPNPYNETFLFAFGRLEKVKGFDLLIKAYATIKTDRKPKLLIAGDGTQKGALENLINSIGLTECVFLVGRKSPEEIVAYSQNSHAIVISSLRESFGINVLEGIASRRPVLTTNSGGLSEVMDLRFGVMVEPTEESIREGLQLVINNRIDYDSTGIKDYLDGFSVSKMVDNYLALLNNN